MQLKRNIKTTEQLKHIFKSGLKKQPWRPKLMLWIQKRKPNLTNLLCVSAFETLLQLWRFALCFWQFTFFCLIKVLVKELQYQQQFDLGLYHTETKAITRTNSGWIYQMAPMFGQQPQQTPGFPAVAKLFRSKKQKATWGASATAGIDRRAKFQKIQLSRRKFKDGSNSSSPAWHE